MTESDLRALVREAIARHVQRDSTAPSPQFEGAQLARRHSSHSMFVLPAGSDGDGPCLIEPAVTCNHCGYCKSYGH